MLLPHLLLGLFGPGSASKQLLVKDYQWGSLILIVQHYIVVVIQDRLVEDHVLGDLVNPLVPLHSLLDRSLESWGFLSER